MALRVNTNIASITAQRHLASNTLNLKKVFERLSSGTRIVRAADDAAGLAISEKLRTQIKGYSQALANCQDGINMIQTTEGAVQETITILQRIRELAIQASNDTYTQSDRQKIQEEIIQLRQELTRIATTTEFNTKKLLDGSATASRAARDAEIAIKQNVRVGATTVTIPSRADFIDPTNLQVSGLGATTDAAFQLKFIAVQDPTLGSPVSVGCEVRSSVEGVLTTVILSGLNGTNLTNLQNITQITLAVGTSTIATIGVRGDSVAYEDLGKVAQVQVLSQRNSVTIDNGFTFQIGPNQGQFIRFGIDDMTAKALRLEDVAVYGSSDEDSRQKSQETIGVIDDALEYVNAGRARLGALQNRLESTVRSSMIAHENLSNSESRIRDTDMAKETAALTKAQILVQAGTAILAQANVNAQTALALLQ